MNGHVFFLSKAWFAYKKLSLKFPKVLNKKNLLKPQGTLLSHIPFSYITLCLSYI